MKSEIEKVWSDWEDRCLELEDLKQQAEFKLNESEVRIRDLNKTVTGLRREAKDLREGGEQARQELKII